MLILPLNFWDHSQIKIINSRHAQNEIPITTTNRICFRKLSCYQDFKNTRFKINHPSNSSHKQVYCGVHIATKQENNHINSDHTTSVNKYTHINFRNQFRHKVTPNYTIINKTIRYTTKELNNCLKYCNQLDIHRQCQNNYT